MKSFVVFFACVGVALAYSTGAPADACDNLTPQHGPVKSQTSAAPYSLASSVQKVRSGDIVTITLSGNGSEDKIKGFLIQARDGKNALGHFKVVDQLNSQLLDCNAKGVSLRDENVSGYNYIIVVISISELNHPQEAQRKWNLPSSIPMDRPKGL